MIILNKRTPINVLIYTITEGLAQGILHLKFASICLDASKEYDTLLKVCKYAGEVLDAHSGHIYSDMMGLSDALSELPDETIIKIEQLSKKIDTCPAVTDGIHLWTVNGFDETRLCKHCGTRR